MAALAAFEEPITLIAGGLAKLDAAAYEPLCETIAKRVFTLITIGQAAGLIADSARIMDCRKTKSLTRTRWNKRLSRRAKLTPTGGIVLLSPACASFDQFRSYEQRGEMFRTLVKKYAL